MGLRKIRVLRRLWGVWVVSHTQIISGKKDQTVAVESIASEAQREV